MPPNLHYIVLATKYIVLAPKGEVSFLTPPGKTLKPTTAALTIYSSLGENMKSLRILGVLFVGILGSATAFACIAWPKKVAIDHSPFFIKEMTVDASSIKFKDAKGRPVVCHFDTKKGVWIYKDFRNKDFEMKDGAIASDNDESPVVTNIVFHSKADRAYISIESPNQVSKPSKKIEIISSEVTSKNTGMTTTSMRFQVMRPPLQEASNQYIPIQTVTVSHEEGSKGIANGENLAIDWSSDNLQASVESDCGGSHVVGADQTPGDRNLKNAGVPEVKAPEKE